MNLAKKKQNTKAKGRKISVESVPVATRIAVSMTLGKNFVATGENERIFLFGNGNESLTKDDGNCAE